MAKTIQKQRRGKGEGSIFYMEEKKLWCSCIITGKNDLGKNIRKYLYGKTREEVLDKKKKVEAEVTSGEYINPVKVSLSAFLAEWLNTCCKSSLRPSTYARYQSVIKTHVNPSLGQIQLSKLTAIQVQSFYSKKLQEGLKPRSVRNIHTVLHKALNQAVKWSFISKNVSSLVELPKPIKQEMKVLTANQVRTFLDEAKKDRFYCLYLLAIATGLREGELLALQWSDIDLEGGILSVNRTVKELNGKLLLGEPKTAKGRRLVTLPDFAVKALEEHKGKQEEDIKWVFPDRKGGLIRAQNMYNRSFKPLMKKINQPQMRFHDLRHTHATLLLLKKVSPKILQERLGHASVTLTLDTYSHVIPEMQRLAAKELDSLFE